MLVRDFVLTMGKGSIYEELSAHLLFNYFLEWRFCRQNVRISVHLYIFRLHEKSGSQIGLNNCLLNFLMCQTKPEAFRTC